MSLINLLVGLRNAWQKRQKRQRGYDELMALDDHALADIGIRRSEIPAIVEGFYQTDPAGPGRCPSVRDRSEPMTLALGSRWLPPI